MAQIKFLVQGGSWRVQVMQDTHPVKMVYLSTKRMGCNGVESGQQEPLHHKNIDNTKAVERVIESNWDYG